MLSRPPSGPSSSSSSSSSSSRLPLHPKHLFLTADSLHQHLISSSLRPSQFVYIETRELLPRKLLEIFLSILQGQLQTRQEPIEVYIVTSYWLSAARSESSPRDRLLLHRFLDLVDVMIRQVRASLIKVTKSKYGASQRQLRRLRMSSPIIIAYHPNARNLVIYDDQWSGYCPPPTTTTASSSDDRFSREYANRMSPRECRISRWNGVVFCGISKIELSSFARELPMIARIRKQQQHQAITVSQFTEDPSGIHTVLLFRKIMAQASKWRTATSPIDILQNGRYQSGGHVTIQTMARQFLTAPKHRRIEEYPLVETIDGQVLISSNFLPPKLRERVLSSFCVAEDEESKQEFDQREKSVVSHREGRKKKKRKRTCETTRSSAEEEEEEHDQRVENDDRRGRRLSGHKRSRQRRELMMGEPSAEGVGVGCSAVVAVAANKPPEMKRQRRMKKCLSPTSVKGHMASVPPPPSPLPSVTVLRIRPSLVSQKQEFVEIEICVSNVSPDAKIGPENVSVTHSSSQKPATIVAVLCREQFEATARVRQFHCQALCSNTTHVAVISVEKGGQEIVARQPFEELDCGQILVTLSESLVLRGEWKL